MLSRHLVVSSRRRILANSGTAFRRKQQSFREISFRPSLTHSGSFSDDPTEKDKARLYIHSLPCLTVSSLGSQQRWMSSSSSSESKNNDENSTEPGKVEEEEKEKETFTPRSIRQRAKDDFEAFQERARSMGTSVGDHYREFREHPRESARQGAKTAGSMLKMYGPVFVGTYMSVYFATLLSLWAGVETGILDPVSLFSWLGHADDSKDTVHFVVEFMEKYSITKPYAHVVENNPSFANLAVAWIAVKFTEPIRLAIALPLTPRVARYFGYAPKKGATEEKGKSPSKEDQVEKDQKS